jgi:SAM-dependent methyltransferase
MHQVLHFLPDPRRALVNAAQLLRPSGRLVLVDFAPHGLEFLRERHAHRRLGFSDDEIRAWCAAGGVPALDVRTLAPPAGARDALTVKIWAGDRVETGASQ